MSKAYSPEVPYTCHNDCVQGGCPGHTLVLQYYGPADCYYTIEDGARYVRSFDPNYLAALVRAYEAMRE